MSQPFFTVATISYNSSKWIEKTIHSVLGQSCSDFEYIISDDNSADHSYHIISSFEDSRIVKFRQEKNLGEYPNRNFVLSNAKGKYLIFVDGDDVLYQHSLRRLKEYLEYFPAATSLWGVPPADVPFCLLPVSLKPAETIRWIYLANITMAQQGFGETVFRVETLRKIGGLPTHLISGDTLLKKKIAMEGDTILAPLGFMFWRRSPEQASAKLKREYNGFINNVLIDREVIALLEQKNIDVPVATIKENIDIRNIKLLFKHTFRKGKIMDGLKLFSSLQFKAASLKYLFRKGDYTYRKELESKMLESDFNYKISGNP